MGLFVSMGIILFAMVTTSYLLARALLWLEKRLETWFPTWSAVRVVSVAGFTVLGAFCALLVVAGLITGV